MIRPLRLYPDPVLRRRCAPVGAVDDAVRALLRDLLDTLYDAGGRGLAAPQVGVASRAFVMDLGWRDGEPEPLAFVDPRVTAAARGTAMGVERCLSIPGRPRCVPRPDWASLQWTDGEGAPREGRFEGAAAVCVLHEIDHLDGRLILDHGEDVPPGDVEPPRPPAGLSR